jgi:hypothetical protein
MFLCLQTSRHGPLRSLGAGFRFAPPSLYFYQRSPLVPVPVEGSVLCRFRNTRSGAPDYGHPANFYCPFCDLVQLASLLFNCGGLLSEGGHIKYIHQLNLFIDFVEESFRTGCETEVARPQFHRWKRGRINQPPLAHSMVFCWDTIYMNVKRHT